MSKPDSDATLSEPRATPGSEACDAVSLISYGITFVQYSLPLQNQKIPDDAQPVSPWRWSIRAGAC